MMPSCSGVYAALRAAHATALGRSGVEVSIGCGGVRLNINMSPQALRAGSGY